MANPAAYTLVHHVGAGRKPAFAPMRLMNPVTYLGRTPQNDIVLPSDNVSRRHAKLIVTETGVTVHDLDSHNGIFLNGKKVRSTPMAVGDLLYIADVCIELKRNPDADQFSSASKSRVVHHDEITGEEDPNARNLAALLRANELVTSSDESVWNIHAIELCRELTEATVAVLVWQTSDGLLETPVVLQPEDGRRGEVPVLWPIVRKALDDGLAQFSPDLKRQPILNDEAVLKSDVGAVCAAPIMVEGRAEGVIYLARPTPSPVFTQRELDTVGAIAQLASLRRRPQVEATAIVSGVAPQADTLALQAKAEAAEERLAEAQADVRTLTERIHGLEADALKLKQQIELERQNAVEAKREADRGRAEATKLEQGLHKTDEDVKKLKDALARSEEERNKLRETVRSGEEDRRVKGTEVDRLREALRASEAEREAMRAEIGTHVRSAQERDDEIRRLAAELERVTGEVDAGRARLQAALDERSQAEEQRAAVQDALRSALRQTLPPTMAEHVEALADGAPVTTDVAVRPVAALFVTLRGFDAWAISASPADVKARLDHFCNAVALRVRANGGRIEQVLGHHHLILFPADAGSVRAAVRCGVEVAALVPPDGPPGMQIGVVSALHVASSSAGFFGEGDAATRVEAGEAVLVSRSVAGALSHEPAFYVSDTVQRLVHDDPAFSLGVVGPTAIVGTPGVMLYRVMATDGRTA